MISLVDNLSREKRSKVMASIRGTNTKPEVIIRRLLWSAGKRYKIHDRSVYGTPDISNKSKKLAVFLDGCFWHGCNVCYREPSSNIVYWRDKIRQNRARREKVKAFLVSEGWDVLEFWEHAASAGRQSADGGRDRSRARGTLITGIPGGPAASPEVAGPGHKSSKGADRRRSTGGTDIASAKGMSPSYDERLSGDLPCEAGGDAVGVIGGLYPAIYLSRFRPAEVLKANQSSAHGASWLRSGLVVFQFAISIALIAGRAIAETVVKEVVQGAAHARGSAPACQVACRSAGTDTNRRGDERSRRARIGAPRAKGGVARGVRALGIVEMAE